MKSIRRIIAAVLACYLAAMAGVTIFQRRMIYRPPSRTDLVLGTALPIRATTETGLPVVAIYFPASSGHATMVHFHGNAEQLADTVPIGRTLRAKGLGFFAVEYPGYGAANGATPTESHIYEVAEAALHHLHDVLHVPIGLTMIEGHSLGSGVAAEMARRGQGGRLVLVSPFTSMISVASMAAPFFPVSLLLLDRYDTLAKAPQLRLPVLILHGRNDKLVPVAMGERLAERIRGSTLAIDEGAGHNDLLGSKWYVDQVVRFADGAQAAFNKYR